MAETNPAAQPPGESPPRVSVIIPIFGRLGDVPRLVAALNRQTVRPHEILLIDSSPGGAVEVPPGVRYFKNPVDRGLSGDYNLGAEKAEGDCLLLMQQDCLPATPTDLEENLRRLTPGRVAVTSSVTLPRENWEHYSFWGQALMARWVGTFRQGISGKFDLIRADAFRKIGGYDCETFALAGEDMDLCLRLTQQGEVHVAPTQILHLHNQSRETRLGDLFKKHYQLAESFGALTRKWGFGLRRIPYASYASHHAAKYLYVLIPLACFYPLYVLPALFVLSNLTNLEVWRIRSWRKLWFLLLSPALFLAGAVATLQGFLTGRQRFSVNP